jgi:phage tail sheath protein FI
MPVAVSYPGVYIQEVPSGVHTITGVSTSIGAFFGRTAKGPIDKAVRCLSFADFLREFGGPHPLSDLATSVRQFFDNGGTDCYVVRLAKGALSASVALKNLSNAKNVLTATAKAAGTWAHDVKLEIDYNTPNPDDSFNLAAIHEVAGNVIAREDFSNLSMNPFSPRFAPTFVTQSSKLIDLNLHPEMTAGGATAIDPAAFINTIANTPAGFSQGRRPFVGTAADNLRDNIKSEINKLLRPALPVDLKSKFSISINGGPFLDINLAGIDVTLPDPAFDTREKVLNKLVQEINDQLHLTDPALNVVGVWEVIEADKVVVPRFTSATGPQFTSVQIRRAPANDFAVPMLLGVEQGGIEVARYSNMRPVFTGTAFFGGPTYPADFITDIGTFANLANTAVSGVKIGTSPKVMVNLATAGAKNFEQAPSGFDGVREKLRIIAQKVNSDPNVPWSAELWGYHLAFRKKSGGINDKADVVTEVDVTFGQNFISNTRQYVLGNAGMSPFQSAGTPGNNGTFPDAGTYGGDPVKHTGFYALDKVDLFNLMVLPGDREVDESTYLQIIGPASVYCNQHRAFLLVDAPASWTDVDIPEADASAVNALRALVVKDHSAVFYPRAQYSDAGLKKLIGPSGMIAGLMARIDSQRGVWKAPAGTEAALFGVLDLEVNLTDLENGVLNKLGVNCLRKFPTGIVNWGARTLDGSDDIGSEWKYIPIRRLALFLEESLFRGTKWVVFEPNDEPLWASIRLNLNAFMMGLFRQGAFQGSTPDKAFYVKCDGETTTQNDRNLGIVNIEVGFAPLKPAEFVIIKIQQIAGDLT